MSRSERESLFAYVPPQHFTWGSAALLVGFMAFCGLPFILIGLVYMGAPGEMVE